MAELWDSYLKGAGFNPTFCNNLFLYHPHNKPYICEIKDKELLLVQLGCKRVPRAQKSPAPWSQDQQCSMTSAWSSSPRVWPPKPHSSHTRFNLRSSATVPRQAALAVEPPSQSSDLGSLRPWTVGREALLLLTELSARW